MDNISSPRIEPLGPDAERDPEPPPGNFKKRTRPPRQKLSSSVDLGPRDNKDLDQDDQELGTNPEPNEQHQLDERV